MCELYGKRLTFNSMRILLTCEFIHLSAMHETKYQKLAQFVTIYLTRWCTTRKTVWQKSPWLHYARLLCAYPTHAMRIPGNPDLFFRPSATVCWDGLVELCTCHCCRCRGGGELPPGLRSPPSELNPPTQHDLITWWVSGCRVTGSHDGGRMYFSTCFAFCFLKVRDGNIKNNKEMTMFSTAEFHNSVFKKQYLVHVCTQNT